jgi:cytochrome c553
VAVAGVALPPPPKAAPCATCHGSQGISTAPDAPNLAGQPKSYLEDQLRGFRDGKRIHPVMNVVAKPLTDTDIEQLARWYSSIVIEVAPLPP